MNSQGHRVCDFIETFCTLSGSFLNKPFELLPFQREVINDIYKTDEDGRRLHRTYLYGLPRKNGKTQIAAALGLYHLIADPTDTAPLAIAAAGDRQQARLVFDEVRRMIQASPDLSQVCEVLRNEVRSKHNGGVFRTVSADAKLAQGYGPSFIVVDEYHVFRNRELYDALTLGSATRQSPLTLVISTAGYDLESPLGELYRYGRKCQSGEVDDPTFGMTWHGPDDHEDYDHNDPETWKKYNPAWDHFINVEEFESAHRQTHQAAFTRYRLNGWTASETSWLPAGAFEKLTSDRRLQADERVVLGFDGAFQNDSTALVACTLDEPKHLEIIGLWEKPEGQHGMGWRTPVEEVEAAIREAFEMFNVVSLFADPWRFEASLARLADEGYPVIEFPTTSVQRMTQATQTAYDLILDEKITHTGDPALVRHFLNAVLKEDPRRGSRITKDRKNSTRKIDAAVASVIALHAATSWRDDEPPQEAQLLAL